LDAEAPQDGAALPDSTASKDTGLPDAGPRPDAIVHDYCGEAFFKLHIGGESEEIYGYSLSGSRLAYNRVPRFTIAFDLYVLELDTCTEYRLTRGARATSAFILGSGILWSENRESSPAPDYHCMDIYRYDLELWREEQLTDHPLCEWNPETNGRFIAYERSTAEGGDSPRENLLWDMVAGTELQYAEPGAQAGYYELSERWLAWSGYTQLATSIGKDVFVRDLETGEETHIENSAQYYCYDVRLDGDYLTYACSEYWVEAPYYLFLRHLPTGEELHLDGAETDTGGISHGAIHSGIVAWNTTKHIANPDLISDISDIELYDIETGIFRRLTTVESGLRAALLQPPWLACQRRLPGQIYEYYVAHLGRLGVLDDNGRLIPGDGVLGPPE
jgi:hypothetical protein